MGKVSRCLPAESQQDPEGSVRAVQLPNSTGQNGARKIKLQYVQNVTDVSLANKTSVQYIFAAKFSL